MRTSPPTHADESGLAVLAVREPEVCRGHPAAAVPREDPSHQRLAVRRLSQRSFRHVRRLRLQRVSLGRRQASFAVVATQRRVRGVRRVHDPQVHVARGRKRHAIALDRGRGRGVGRGRSRDDGGRRRPSPRRAVRRARRGMTRLERPSRVVSRAVVRRRAGERGCGRGRAAPRSREMRWGAARRERYHRPTQRGASLHRASGGAPRRV